MVKVIDYCLKDVEVTKTVFDRLVEHHGKVNIYDHENRGLSLRLALPTQYETKP